MNAYLIEGLLFVFVILASIGTFYVKKTIMTNEGTTISSGNAKPNISKKIFEYLRKHYFNIFVILFAIFFFVWFFSFSKRIQWIVTIETSPLDNGFLTVFTSLVIWGGLSSTCLLFTQGKVGNQVKFLTFINKWITPVFLILNAGFVYQVHLLWINNAYSIDTISNTFIFFYIYLALGLYCCALIWIDNFRFEKFNRNEILALVGILLLLIFVSTPTWIPQMYFGLGNPSWHVQDLSADHRVFLYLSILIPLIIYFIFKHVRKIDNMALLTYISLITMLNFAYKYTYLSLTTPWALPFHLCNTAMFILPICIIFNTKRLFYFTYFINVFGALTAILMPNYSDNIRVFSEEVMYFWQNHIIAYSLPLLCVSFGIFDKPKMKHMFYSIIWFTGYFLLVLILNVYFNATGHSVDFFFLNSDFITDKLGQWADNLFNITTSFTINGVYFEFHPAYQVAFYLVYVLIAFAMWYVYVLFYNIGDYLNALEARSKKIRLDHYALLAKLNGRSAKEPMDPNAGITLKITNFSKRYGKSNVYAVKNANLEVHGGEIFGFLGPNGAGKSTTIKCIVGIQSLSEGQITICGYDVSTQSVEAKRITGYVPDHYALYEKLTGREYINFIADIYGVSQIDRNERIKYYVDLFQLNDSFDSTISTYSHGMKQKITTIAALIHNPKLWILDEPLTGLDPDSIYQVKECMRHHASLGNIVMFSSHIIDVVENLCNRIVIIQKGHMGTPITMEDVHKLGSLEQYYMSSTKSLVKPIKVEEEK